MKYKIYSCRDRRLLNVILPETPEYGAFVTLEKEGYPIKHTTRYNYVKLTSSGIAICKTDYFYFRARKISEVAQ